MQIIFIHGSGSTGYNWKHQSDHFPGSIAVDLPGHPEGELLPTIKEASDWVKQLVDDNGYEDVVIVGHSLGGAVALQYALDHPEELAGIVLVGSGARLRVHPATLKFLEKAVADPSLFETTGALENPKLDPEHAAGMAERRKLLGPEPSLNDLRACDAFDVIPRLGEIETPTHAIVGTEDVMTPPMYSEFLADKMPNASCTIIEGGSHSVFAEYPDQVNAAIEQFLAGLESG